MPSSDRLGQPRPSRPVQLSSAPAQVDAGQDRDRAHESCREQRAREACPRQSGRATRGRCGRRSDGCRRRRRRRRGWSAGRRRRGRGGRCWSSGARSGERARGISGVVGYPREGLSAGCQWATCGISVAYRASSAGLRGIVRQSRGGSWQRKYDEACDDANQHEYDESSSCDKPCHDACLLVCH